MTKFHCKKVEASAIFIKWAIVSSEVAILYNGRHTEQIFFQRKYLIEEYKLNRKQS